MKKAIFVVAMALAAIIVPGIITAQTLTVTVDDPAFGRVRSSDGIDCGTYYNGTHETCSKGFTAPSYETLYAETANGSFVRWEGGCSGTSTLCTIWVDGNNAVKAIFEERDPIPGKPTARQPKGSTVDRHPIFSWDAATHAVTYRLVILQGGLVWDSVDGVSATSTTANREFVAGDYVWYVYGVSALGRAGPNSDVLDLRIVQGDRLTVASEGPGSVTSTPAGIDCGLECTAYFDVHTPITLTATADPGSVFVGWEGESCVGTGDCVVTLRADGSSLVTARFEEMVGASLVQHWQLDGNVISSVDGSSGTQFGGTFVAGHIGQALALNGIGDYVDMGNTAAVQISNSQRFSAGAWVYFNELCHPPGHNDGAPPCDMSIIDKMAGAEQGLNGEGWRILKQQDGHIWFCLGSSASPDPARLNGCTPTSNLTVRSGTVVQAHTWYHVVGVRTDTALRIYINGVLDGVTNVPANTDTGRNSASLRLGSYVLEGSHLNGLIDDVRLYRGALTDQEVAALAETGISPAPPLPVPASGSTFESAMGHIAAWTFGDVLRLEYDVRAPASYAGQFRDNPPLDLGGSNMLTFGIKGDAGGEHVLVGLHDSAGREQKVVVSKFLPGGITGLRQSVSIPLDVFTTVDRHNITRFVWAFENQLGTDAGAVEIDQVRFENSGTVLPIPVENFDDGIARTSPGGNWWIVSGGGGGVSGSYDTFAHIAAYRITAVAQPPNDWAVLAFDLRGLDVLQQKYLTFWIRGERGGEHPNVYLVSGLPGAEVRKPLDLEIYVNVTTEWTKVAIPLADFAHVGVDRSRVTRLEFAWEWEIQSETIELDDITFEPAADRRMVALAPRTGLTFSSSVGGALDVQASGTGYRYSYDVRLPGSYAGQIWRYSAPVDVGDANALAFRIKGDVGGEAVLVGIRDTAGHEQKVVVSKFLSEGIDTAWQLVRIPLDVFTTVDRHAVILIVWAFENQLSAASGAVEVDDVRFEHVGTVMTIPVENFNDGIARTGPGGNWWTVSGGDGVVSGAYEAALSGAAYRITATVPPQGGWAVLAFDLAGLNVSRHQVLTFWIRGDRGGEHPNVYLASGSPWAETRRLVDLQGYIPVTTDWKKATIPLADFAGQGIDLDHVLRLEFAWEWEPRSETITLDNITFEP